MKKILLVGAPNSGKGAFTREFLGKISQETAVLSGGDMLREIAMTNVEVALAISSGKFVKDELVTPLLINKIKETKSEILILDGFPRNTAQTDAFTEAFINCEDILVIELCVSDEICKARSIVRRVCVDCGQTQPVAARCAFCGGDLVVREDDKKIDVRLSEYRQKTKPILKILKKKYQCVSIDASDVSKEVPKILALL